MVIFPLALLTFPLLLQPPLTSALALPRSSVALRLSQQVGGKDGAPMVLIPAGEFTMGKDDAAPDERPAHRVHLDAFYIDRYEVTIARYAKFLESEDHDLPFLWHDAKQGHHGTKPVLGVDWYDALAYCRWADKRLPTEAEWEKAARGTDSRLYPWGNDSPSRIHANFEQESKKGYSALTPVGSFERGKSPYGVYDMAGNVWEWVGDRYGEHYYQNSPERVSEALAIVNDAIAAQPVVNVLSFITCFTATSDLDVGRSQRGSGHNGILVRCPFTSTRQGERKLHARFITSEIAQIGTRCTSW